MTSADWLTVAAIALGALSGLLGVIAACRLMQPSIILDPSGTIAIAEAIVQESIRHGVAVRHGLVLWFDESSNQFRFRSGARSLDSNFVTEIRLEVQKHLTQRGVS